MLLADELIKEHVKKDTRRGKSVLWRHGNHWRTEAFEHQNFLVNKRNSIVALKAS
jgi:hypothetical protein